jgi:hypothetical protein
MVFFAAIFLLGREHQAGNNTLFTPVKGAAFEQVVEAILSDQTI